MNIHLHAIRELVGRYTRVFRDAWAERKQWQSPDRSPLERQFLPATLELLETPPSPLPRIIIWTLIAAFTFALLWACFGKLDTVAVAQGRVIASGQSKVVQPLEVSVVRRILVRDGQEVKAGQVLIELDATAASAEANQTGESLQDARLAATRARTLLAAVRNRVPPVMPALADVPDARLQKESSLLASQYGEYTARIAAMSADLARREAERRATEELMRKLEQTLPIARARAEDYKGLAEKNFVSRHGYLEREQARIEAERDLAYQQAKLAELTQAVNEARQTQRAYTAEFQRRTTEALADAEAKITASGAAFEKADNRRRLMQLTAPVAGTVQQLAIHTEGGVVTEAQALMVIVPHEHQAEVEAVLENKDIGFVRPGQAAEVKTETFPFTRYGTLPATVHFVSQDAVPDEKRGPVFQTKLRLASSTINVDGKQVRLSPGMNVTAEIKTGERRVIEYFISPLKKTADEGLRER